MSQNKDEEERQERCDSTTDHIFELFGFEGGMCFLLGSIKHLADGALFNEDTRTDLERIRTLVNTGLDQLDRREAPKQVPFGFTREEN